MKWVRLIGGTFLILLGIVGGFVPILQGWIFILAGLALLAPEFPPAQRLLDKLRSWRSGPGKGKRDAPTPAGKTQGFSASDAVYHESADPHLARIMARRQASLAEALQRTAWERAPRRPRILDVGGGEGYVSAGLHPFGTVGLVELDPAKVKKSGQFSRAGRINGDARRLPFRSGSVDGVLLWSVLDHIEECGAALREAHRVLVPGGYLLLNTNNFLFYRHLPERDYLGHVHKFSAAWLLRRGRETGFVPVLMLGNGFPGQVHLDYPYRVANHPALPRWVRIPFILLTNPHAMNKFAGLDRWTARLGRRWPRLAFDLTVLLKKT